MPSRKRIAIVAHNNKKKELIKCLKQHRIVLVRHDLFGTGTTGSLVEKELGLSVTKLQSGPLGGDQQLGSMIVSNKIDILFFLVDPLDVHPHIDDVRALLRISQVWNIVNATTTSTIDFILRSFEMNEAHTRDVRYLTRPKATAVKNVTKPKLLAPGQRTPTGDTERTRTQLPNLLHERKQPVLQKSILRNVN
ncbi:unnamed protein product [Adineta steineri]|nr:unnamed protein product [Adineta steineri]CAF1429965.1 unnamed protein product [Adineta steineri]CAF3894884.1 unnamed protein product [Adineta steineri]